MTKLTETLKFTADNKAVVAMGEGAYHSREGNALHRWIDAVTPGATASTLTGASELEYTIASGKQVFVTGFTCTLETASDDCSFKLVAHDGSAWVQVAPHVHVQSDATPASPDTKRARYDPPIQIKNSDGYTAIGVLVDANDSGAKVSASWCGWVEDE